MKLLPTPATVAEQYLAAILDELRALRVAVGDRGPVQPGADVSHLDGRFTPSIPGAAGPAPSPKKRTRARTPR